MTEAGDIVRMHELHDLFPILSRSTWVRAVASGALPSHTLPGMRVRLVRVDDVIAFLRGGARAPAARATPASNNSVASRVDQALFAAGDVGIEKSKIRRALGMNVPGVDIDKALRDLEGSGHARCFTAARPGVPGRRPEVWVSCVHEAAREAVERARQERMR